MNKDKLGQVIQGDSLTVLKSLPEESVNCCVTSPPYWGLRDYGVEGQLGLEKTPDEYVAKMVEIFREVKRVLRKDGTCWVNLGDSYAHKTKGTGGGWANDPKNYANKAQKYGSYTINHGLKEKDLVGIPWRVAFALQADGWYLRQDIIWHKPNPMPESVKDRCTKAHEYVFLLTKSGKYWFDGDGIKEKASETSGWAKQRAKGENTWKYNDTKKRISTTGQKIESSTLGTVGLRNKRSVWTVTTKPYKEAHFATFPPDLIEPMVIAGCPKAGVVLDPFAGSGTTCAMAKKLGRGYIGIELNSEYIKLINKRLEGVECELF